MVTMGRAVSPFAAAVAPTAHQEIRPPLGGRSGFALRVPPLDGLAPFTA